MQNLDLLYAATQNADFSADTPEDQPRPDTKAPPRDNGREQALVLLGFIDLRDHDISAAEMDPRRSKEKKGREKTRL